MQSLFVELRRLRAGSLGEVAFSTRRLLVEGNAPKLSRSELLLVLVLLLLLLIFSFLFGRVVSEEEAKAAAAGICDFRRALSEPVGAENLTLELVLWRVTAPAVDVSWSCVCCCCCCKSLACCKREASVGSDMRRPSGLRSVTLLSVSGDPADDGDDEC